MPEQTHAKKQLQTTRRVSIMALRGNKRRPKSLLARQAWAAQQMRGGKKIALIPSWNRRKIWRKKKEEYAENMVLFSLLILLIQLNCLKRGAILSNMKIQYLGNKWKSNLENHIRIKSATYLEKFWLLYDCYNHSCLHLDILDFFFFC